MTTLQKVVKYVAMAFAIFLIVSILGGVLKLLGLISFVSDVDGTTEELTGYTVSADIEELEIEIAAAEFTVSTGEEFAVESNLKNLTVKEEGNRLIIKERKHATINYNGKALLNIVIPENTVFEEVYISTGAGKVKIDTLSADELTMELGAGLVEIAELNAYKESLIVGGAGSVNIESGNLNDLDMDMGVGKVVLKSELTGESEINQGIGATKLMLLGDKYDYSIEVEKGIGSIKVDGLSMSNNEVFGTGSNEIEIHGGIGEIEISFEE